MNTPKTIHNVESIFHATLTKRELFAAMALQGILSCDYHGNQAHINNLTDYAVAYADSLIDQLGGEG